MHDSLYRNSIYLLASQIINAGTGFLFWIICARLFTIEIVGLASAAISYSALFSAVANLGISYAIVRFMPSSRNQIGLLADALSVSTFSSLVVGGIALLFLNTLAPEVLHSNRVFLLAISLLGLILFSVVRGIMDSVFTSFRKAEFVLGKAVLISLFKLVSVFLFAGFGVIGILFPHILGLGVGIAFALWLTTSRLLPFFICKFLIDYHQLFNLRSFAFGNLTANIFSVLPVAVVPIVILQELGSNQTAYFYIVFQIAAFQNLICSATSQSLLSEVSQKGADNNMHYHFKKALVNMYQLLILSALFLSITGYYILYAYGLEYARNGYLLLLILLISSLFGGINWLGNTMLSIRNKMYSFIFMNALNSLFILTFTYLLVDRGLLYVGLAWLASQLLTALLYILFFNLPSKATRYFI